MRPVWLTWASVLVGMAVGSVSGGLVVGRVAEAPAWLLAGGGAVALWQVAVRAIEGLAPEDPGESWTIVRSSVDLAVAWGALVYTLVCLPAISWFAFVLGVVLVGGAVVAVGVLRLKGTR